MIVQTFDTETTGLVGSRRLPLDKQPYITEWYSCAADLKTGEIFWELDFLIKPPIAITEEITRITGITDADVADAPMFAVVAPIIRAAIELGPRMVAHNASFDMEMVQIEFERLGQKIEFPKRPLCTVEATMALKGHRLNLQGLHEHLFKEKFANAHRARNDVQALLRCCVELHARGEI
jgi:DNA polymerase-3 subunit epsilon